MASCPRHGRWKITDLIGAGGMGAVYRAQHTTIGKPMAVKVLHPRLGTKGDWAKRSIDELAPQTFPAWQG